MPSIEGVVAPGFEPVQEAFEANFAYGHERGAAFAAYVDGRRVALLRGGVADAPAQRPWQADTLQPLFSGTKGLLAVCALLLVERGQLELDARVTRWWPQYGRHGKHDTRVRHLLSHTAGVPGIAARPIAEQELLDADRMAQLLAEETPAWEPGTTLCYHPLTYGWLVGELIRRVDGRAAGRFFAEEVAAPLALELWLGLPPAQEPRVARLALADGWGGDPLLDRERIADRPLALATYHNPPGLWTRERFAFWNEPATHAAGLPGAGAIGSVDAVARLYACLARGGELDGVRLLSESTLAEGRRLLVTGRSALAGEPSAFATGFMLQSAGRWPLGPPAVADAFGHDGAGGSCHGAWPSRRVGFSYAMNLLRDDEPPGSGRDDRLLAALADCVDARAR